VIAGAASDAVPLWLSGPFALLLLLIATMPLSPARVRHLWERFYAVVAIGLGAAVALYYAIAVTRGGSRVAGTLEDYVSFIALIGSLFVVAGGIHIRIRGEAQPLGNVVYLFIGAVLANMIGTTGASMVLIRPWIAMNRYRVTSFHVVFFVLVVSNIGGALTPIGDPPLFLGYLHGVPFFWLVEHAAPPWGLTLALVLGAFWAVDRRNFLRAPGAVREKLTSPDPLVMVDGLPNVLFLGLVMVAVFLPDRWFLREIVMVAAAAGSYRSTRQQVHAANAFGFGPLKEVAILFAGIFLTMMPALDYLEHHGAEFGFRKPLQYYFATGALSSVLDNAPTYLNFLTLAEAALVPPDVQRQADAEAAKAGPAGAARAREAVLVAWLIDPRSRTAEGVQALRFVVAVSLGAVFFGAMTYIGNGPNFMVKSIAESAGVHVPTFFGYVFRYSLPILLPILALVGWLWLG
jgi:Na+/H+ antiporter NhaD/arsenite permease-like protein